VRLGSRETRGLRSWPRSIGKASVQAFAARDLPNVVEIKYWSATNCRRPCTSVMALSKDIARGLRDEALVKEMIKGLVWWRCTCVNPGWGFVVGGQRPNVLLKPIDARRLFRWIDAAMKAAGVRREDVKAGTEYLSGYF